MVPVIGGPAQGQLGEVAGADHQAALHIGHIHEHLGAFPGLAVFKGHVLVFIGLADVLEMLAHSGADVDAAEIRAQGLAKDLGIAAGAAGGAEAGHGNGQGVLGGALEQG